MLKNEQQLDICISIYNILTSFFLPAQRTVSWHGSRLWVPQPKEKKQTNKFILKPNKQSTKIENGKNCDYVAQARNEWIYQTEETLSLSCF